MSRRTVVIIWLLGSLLLPAGPAAASDGYVIEATIELTGDLYTTIWAVAVGDPDGDGRSELIANYDWYIGSGTPRLVFFERDGTGYREEAALSGVSLAWGNGWGDPMRQVSVSDADGDGDADVTFAGVVSGSRGLYVYSWNGTSYQLLDSVAGNYIEALVADGNGDGASEIFAIDGQWTTVFTWEAGGLKAGQTWSAGDVISSVRVANVDADPTVEVVLAAGALNFETYEWDGTAYVADGAGYVAYGFISQGIAIGDVDRDTEPEILRVDYHRHVVVYGWDGSSFAVEASWTSESVEGDNIGACEIGDTDGDGMAELLVGHFGHVYGNSILVYAWNGTGYSITWNSGPLSLYTHSLAVGDVDDDGISEIIQGTGSEGRVRVIGRGSEDLPPIAAASASPTVTHIGEAVTFNGSSSSDDHGVLEYEWSFGDGTFDVGPVVTHAYERRGPFEAILTVRDTAGQTSEDPILIEVVNRLPVADAGSDQIVSRRTLVTLDGRGSSDPDDDALAYAWSQVAGPAVVLTNPGTAMPGFTPADDGTYRFELTVDDGYGGSAKDPVQVIATNGAPVANAGSDLAVSRWTLVTLDGRGSSDPDDDPLSYAWYQVAGLAVSLTDSGTAMPSFTPAESGTYRFELRVDDGHGGTATDSVQVIATNRAPVADAGSDRTVPKGTVVTMDGRGSSDPEDDPLSYAWSQVAGPAVTLTNPDTARPTFTPAESGTYRFELTVDDGYGGTARDSVQVIATNKPPTIASSSPGAGTVTARSGESRIFTVQASDPDGDALTYVWSVDRVEVSRAGSAYTARFATPGTYRVNVTVTDGEAIAWREWTVVAEGAAVEPGMSSFPWLPYVLPSILVAAVLVSLLVGLTLRRRRG